MIETKTLTTYRCDNCDVTEDIDGVAGMGLPQGWLTVSLPGGNPQQFHSLECLQSWANDDPMDEDGAFMSRAVREARRSERPAAPAGKRTAKRA